MCPKVVDPIRRVLRVLCNGAEPPAFVRGHGFEGLSDAQTYELQTWVNTHLHPDIDWSTGIGAMDAAVTICAEAVANANIPPPEPA